MIDLAEEWHHSADEMWGCVTDKQDGHGSIICETWGIDKETKLARARRIVACVNAMKGVVDPQKLREERDELLKILRGAALALELRCEQQKSTYHEDVTWMQATALIRRIDEEAAKSSHPLGDYTDDR